MVQKNYEANKKWMFIQELIFIYCDKIINSYGTNVFSLLFSENFFFGFWLKSKQKSGRQTAVMMSLCCT